MPLVGLCFLSCDNWKVVASKTDCQPDSFEIGTSLVSVGFVVIIKQNEN